MIKGRRAGTQAGGQPDATPLPHWDLGCSGGLASQGPRPNRQRSRRIADQRDRGPAGEPSRGSRRFMHGPGHRGSRDAVPGLRCRASLRRSTGQAGRRRSARPGHGQDSSMATRPAAEMWRRVQPGERDHMADALDLPRGAISALLATRAAVKPLQTVGPPSRRLARPGQRLHEKPRQIASSRCPQESSWGNSDMRAYRHMSWSARNGRGKALCKKKQCTGRLRRPP
jgi:hypothetical protein